MRQVIGVIWSNPIGSFRAALKAEKVRFLLAGALNTALGFTIFPALLWFVPFFRVHYMAAVLLVQILCTIFAYFSYRTIVFSKEPVSIAGFVRFSSFYLTSYALNWIALPMLVEVAHFDPIISQLCFATALVVASYFWHSKVSFAPRGRAERL